MPQLSVDILINTLKLQHVGYIYDPGLLPLVGNDVYGHIKQPGSLHTSCEGKNL